VYQVDQLDQNSLQMIDNKEYADFGWIKVDRQERRKQLIVSDLQKY